MIKTGCDVLLQNPDIEERVLHSSSVIELEPESFVIELDDETIPLEAGKEVVIFFQDSGEFMQQIVRVGRIVHRSPRLVASLIPLGDATSAESREHFRVSTISTEIRADLGSETHCPVQDISASGFSVVAHKRHDVGSTLEASIEFRGDFFCGTVSIQSILELRPGRLRYGLKVQESDLHASELIDGLGQINLHLEASDPKRST